MVGISKMGECELKYVIHSPESEWGMKKAEPKLRSVL